MEEEPSPGLLPVVEPARPVVDRLARACPARTYNLVFASTQISQLICRCRGQRKDGGALDASGSEPIAYNERIYSLGIGLCCGRAIPGIKEAADKPASGTSEDGRNDEAGTLGSLCTTGVLLGGSGARREKKSLMTVARARRSRTPFGSVCSCCWRAFCGCREGEVGGSKRSSGCMGFSNGG